VLVQLAPQGRDARIAAVLVNIDLVEDAADEAETPAAEAKGK